RPALAREPADGVPIPHAVSVEAGDPVRHRSAGAARRRGRPSRGVPLRRGHPRRNDHAARGRTRGGRPDPGGPAAVGGVGRARQVSAGSWSAEVAWARLLARRAPAEPRNTPATTTALAAISIGVGRSSSTTNASVSPTTGTSSENGATVLAGFRR